METLSRKILPLRQVVCELLLRLSKLLQRGGIDKCTRVKLTLEQVFFCTDYSLFNWSWEGKGALIFSLGYFVVSADKIDVWRVCLQPGNIKLSWKGCDGAGVSVYNVFLPLFLSPPPLPPSSSPLLPPPSFLPLLPLSVIFRCAKSLLSVFKRDVDGVGVIGSKILYKVQRFIFVSHFVYLIMLFFIINF